MDFCITVKSVRGSMVSTTTRICAGRSGVQILDRATELSFLQHIQASTHPASHSVKTSADSLTTHIHIEPSLRISAAIRPLNLSASGTYWDNFIVPRPPTYVRITQPSSSVISHVLISGNLSVLSSKTVIS
jgi:hypothetical protein